MICPRCNGSGVVKDGWRHNFSGDKQLWYCKNCNKKFTVDDGFWKMKNLPETVAEALDLYDAGYSLAGVADHLHKHHAIEISPTSVRNWLLKYGKKIRSFTTALQVHVKKRIHEDEVVVVVNGKKRYFWRAKESKTGFKFSGNVGRRSMANCQRLNRQIKKQCYPSMLAKKKQQKKIRIVSDKLPHYKTTFNKLFRNVCTLRFGIPIKAKQKGLKYNNNVIEGEHPSVNLRITHMRGVDNTEFATAVLHLHDDLDNFTHYRNNKRKTPAQYAGIKLNLGRNKTLNLIYFLHPYLPKTNETR